MLKNKLLTIKKLLGFDVKSNENQLKKRMGWSFVVNISGALISFLLNIELARLLGVEVYGEYVYVLSWVAIFVLLGKFGLDTAALRYIPKYRSEKKNTYIRGFRKKTTQILFVSSVIIAALAAIAITVIDEAMNSQLLMAFYAGALLIPFLAYLILRGAFLQAYNLTVISQFLQLVVRPVVIGIVVFIVWLVLDDSLSSATVMIVNISATTFAIILSYYFFRKKLPLDFFHGSHEFETSVWFKTAVPLLFLTSFNMLINQTDIIMLGVLLDTERAGVYSVAVRVTQFITFVMIVTNSVAAPMMSQLYTENKIDKLQKMITMAAWASGSFGLIVLLVIVLFGEYILGVFGDEFVDAYQVLFIIAISKIVLAVTGTSGYLMSMSGHHKNAAWVMGISAVVNIFLNYVLILNYGIIGAAIASLITAVGWSSVMVILVKKYVGVNSTIFVKF